jgi:hypothetical protein
MATAGRKTKLTPEIIKLVCGYIENGATYKRACQLSSIGERTFHRWKTKGMEAKRGVYWQFWQLVLVSEEKYIQFHLQNINKAAKVDWRASAWALKRKRPDEFGDMVDVNHSGQINVFKVIKPEDIDD